MSSVLAPFPAFCDSHDVSAKIAEDFGNKLRMENGNLRDLMVQEEEGKEVEFSFVCENPSGSAASAEELFHNGQIRPKSPLFAEEYDGASPLRPPLRKLFVERRDVSSSEDSQSDGWNGAPAGSYCSWSRKEATEAPKERCKKSNSTGFSKLWRFRDLKFRSNSEGKDAFVFLNPAAASPKKASSGEGKNDVVRKVKAAKSKTTSWWAPEKHYVMNRARKESEKRRSYLPYRRYLVGFFSSVNGFSRNIHPF